MSHVLTLNQELESIQPEVQGQSEEKGGTQMKFRVQLSAEGRTSGETAVRK